MSFYWNVKDRLNQNTVDYESLPSVDFASSSRCIVSKNTYSCE